ncbi:MAG: hypothetical protein WBB85_13110 [Albidovulum sp.]|uniref:hypothetical protein n=1 Tax=Albidovulum sp. TaxID=1872424 RepID=UPI003CB4A95D
MALYLVMREDLRFLSTPRLDLHDLHATARGVSGALAVLFLSGASVIWIDTGFDPAEIVARPKLMAKLAVICVLVLNGALMHALLFPLLAGQHLRSRAVALLASLQGAVSSVSWLFATFIGVAKPLAGPLGFEGFMALYALALAGGAAVALTVIAPRFHRLANGGQVRVGGAA